MRVLDVAAGLPERTGVHVLDRGAPVRLVGAVEGEPAVGGADAGRVLRQARDRRPAVEVGHAVADGDQGSVRQDQPRELAHVAARGGVPATADDAEARPVGGEREVGDDMAQELRQEIGPRTELLDVLGSLDQKGTTKHDIKIIP